MDENERERRLIFRIQYKNMTDGRQYAVNVWDLLSKALLLHQGFLLPDV